MMTRFVAPAFLLLALVFTACETDDPSPRKPYGWHPPKPIPTEPPPEEPAPTQAKIEEPKPAPSPIPPPTEPAKPVGELPYAKAVPGKPGLVTSPYEPYKGYIDVKNYPPGTEVRDPYTGKTFLVPPF